MGEAGTDREDAPKRSAEWRKLTKDLLAFMPEIEADLVDSDPRDSARKGTLTFLNYRKHGGQHCVWEF